MSNQELIVVKHGTSVVENANHIGLDQSKINFHVWQHLQLRQAGFLTTEVASGATVAGTEYLTEMGEDIDKDEYTAEELAVYGTARQMRHWEKAACPHGISVGQVLASHQEVSDKAEWLSPGALMARQIRALTWERSLIVTNENDAVAVDETGELLESLNQEAGGESDPESDNDLLASNLAILLGARVLLLLGNMHGFAIKGVVQPTIHTADIPDLFQYCAEPSLMGTGGMRSKLRAAAQAAAAGLEVTIGNAFTDCRLLLAGEFGTRVVK